MQAALANLWYWFVRGTVKWLFFKGTGGLKVKGGENVPRKGSLIVAPNHVSHLDPPVTACTLPRRLTFMAKEELFKSKLFGGLIRSLGAFPVKRGTGDTEAIRNAIHLLEEGRAVLVFPEGTRGDGRALQPINRGVVLLAKRTGAAVLPVGIVGTHRKWPKGKGKPRWGRVTVTFGKPFTYADVATEPSESANRDRFAERLAAALLDLCNGEGMGLRSAGSETPNPSGPPAEPETEAPPPEKV